MSQTDHITTAQVYVYDRAVAATGKLPTVGDFTFVDELPRHANTRGESSSNGSGRPRRWQAQHDAMQANPGRWLLMGEGVNPGTAGALNQQQRGHRKEMFNTYGFGFEYVTRNTRVVEGKKVVDLYGRYVGEVAK